MSKTHVINLTITNNTGKALMLDDDWFDHGGLADGYSWPTSIAPGSVATAQCCEASWSPFGCSGWVKYTLNGQPLYFCFSNPAAGSNGIDIGAATSVWNDMQGHYFPVGRGVQLADGTWVAAMICSSGGDINEASWNVTMCDMQVVPANLELQNVEAVHAKFPTTGTRRYYECDNAPTNLPSLALSHFKGISSFAGKLLFTHTNLSIPVPTNGKYLIADLISDGDQGATDGTFDTFHPTWLHPCSSQACGSFMAMGIQRNASSVVSEIQIFDIRMSQVNQPITLLGTIKRPSDGVNGVGMTKETGANGRYLVAGGNGSNLSIYRSNSPSLMPTAAFTQIASWTDFPDSGAGLALITQQGDGTIYLFALNADDSGANNQMNLYRLNLNGNPPAYTQVSTKDMQIPGMSDSVTLLKEYSLAAGPFLAGLLAAFGASVLNSSLRWGKGLAITSQNTIEVYASDRNCLSLSHIPVVGSNKDFSLVVWDSGQPVGQPLYLTTQASDGIWLFDMGSAATPRQIASTAGLGFRGVVAISDTLYLTTQGSDGIWAFDVVSAATPTQIATTAGLGFAGVVAVGNILYLTTQGSDGIWIFNVVAGTTPTQIASTAGLGFTGVVAVGNILCLTSQGDGIWVFNVASAAIPRKIAATAGYGFREITADGNILYLTTQGSDGIWTCDLMSPGTPAQLAPTAGFGFRGLVVIDNVLFLTTQGNDGIWAFGILSADWGIPAQLPSTAGLGFRGVVAVGTVLYLTTQGSDGIWSYDTVAGTAPTQIASTAGLGFNGVVAVGNNLYLIPQESDGIWSFDLVSQATPTKIATTAGFGFRAVVAVGTVLYLTTQGTDGIWSYDTVAGTAPTQIASTAGLGFGGVVALGNKLYLIPQGSDGIWSFDLVSRATPTKIATTAGFGFRAVVAVGTVLYLTTQGSDGIWTCDTVSGGALTQISSTAGLAFRGLIPY
jgi:hypothetical protein